MTLEGCLALADISGYTHYLSGVELDHSTDILADLLGVISDAISSRFQIAKLEGDAVFVHAQNDARGEAFIAAIENTYIAFAERLWNIIRATTCTCQACARLGELSLKFIVHYGEYATHVIGGREELVGREVIVVHRLLKNDIREKTGVNDYAFFTNAFIDRFGLHAVRVGMKAHIEHTEDAGVVEGAVLDLAERLSLDRASRSVIVEPEGAIAFPIEVNVPPATAWEWATSPEKQVLWLAKEEYHDMPEGIPGVGMRTHCVHGDFSIDHEILDWKPFRYLTYRSATPAGPFLITEAFEPIDDGRRTRITMLSKPDGGPGQAELQAQHREALVSEILRARLRLVELLDEVGNRTQRDT